MATRTAVQTAVPNAHAQLVTWSGLLNTDVGSAIQLAHFGDRTVQVTGTFGGGTMTFQGSNDGTNWASLTDPQGNAIAKTAAGLEAVLELPRYVRPSVAGGDGTTDLVVTMFATGGEN